MDFKKYSVILLTCNYRVTQSSIAVFHESNIIPVHVSFGQKLEKCLEKETKLILYPYRIELFKLLINTQSYSYILYMHIIEKET